MQCSKFRDKEACTDACAIKQRLCKQASVLDVDRSVVDYWDKFSQKYADLEELFIFQGCATAYVMTDFAKPGARIIDVGCGTGLGVEIVAGSMLSKHDAPVLVACDFSNNMLDLMQKRFDESDYTQVPSNKFLRVDGSHQEQSSVNLEEMIEGQKDFKKLVLAMQADGTKLPFMDDQFDSYISNLVLLFVKDPVSQMREAYRVLKPGSKAVFTVWGRRERSVFFTIPHQAKVNVGIVDSELQCDGFRIGENIDATVKDLEAIGFSKVKHWFKAMNFELRTGEDFVNFRPFFPPTDTLSELDKNLRDEMIRLYDAASGKDTPDLCNFEIMVILAYKD